MNDSEAIKEISALDLANKIESGAQLENLERIAAAAIIRDYDRLQAARKSGGKSSTQAKRQAARENGKLGGRPKKK